MRTVQVHALHLSRETDVDRRSAPQLKAILYHRWLLGALSLVHCQVAAARPGTSVDMSRQSAIQPTRHDSALDRQML